MDKIVGRPADRRRRRIWSPTSRSVVEEAVVGLHPRAVRGGRHRAASSASSASACAPASSWRSSIPLVLAITFLVMAYLGISLQRISLGALIIALGLLVDDAMIAVEMMVARLEVGDTLRKAATYVYTSTAFPMLTGTLVTVAGFIPIGLNSSAAGEFTFTLFVVIAVSLLVSWIVAVLFAPLLGVTILPDDDEDSITTSRAGSPALSARVLRRLDAPALADHRRHGAAVRRLDRRPAASSQQQFFPSSDRPELIVDWNLPQNARSPRRSDADGALREASAGRQSRHRPLVVLCRPGRGALRARLRRAAGQPLFRPDRSSSPRASRRATGCRPALREDCCARSSPAPTPSSSCSTLGPPVGRPVQYRVSGPDIQTVRDAGAAVRRRRRRQSACSAAPTFDWNEPARVLKVDVLQDKARQLGVTSQDIASALNSIVGGATITQVRDAIYLVNVVGALARGRARLDRDAAEPAAADQQRRGRSRSRRSPTSATSSNSR